MNPKITANEKPGERPNQDLKAGKSSKAVAKEKPVVAPANGKVLSEEEKKRLDNELGDAVGEGNRAKVERLLKAGADANADIPIHITDEELTVLMYASREGYIGIVELLIAHGADVNANDEHGKTALDIAVDEGDMVIIGLLDAARAKI